MNHLSDKILNRVRGHGRGKWVCTPKDFLDLVSRPAVQQALSGPVNQGHLHRAGRGLYHLPRMSKILKRYAPPSQEQIVAAIARWDGIRDDRRGPLFRSSGQGRRQDVLQRSTMTRQTALKMIKRRVRDAGLPGEITYHSFGGPASPSTCVTAASRKSPRASPVTSRPAPRNCTIAPTGTFA